MRSSVLSEEVLDCVSLAPALGVLVLAGALCAGAEAPFELELEGVAVDAELGIK